MTTRKNLTPPTGVPAANGVHAMRRGGARREVSARVLLKAETGASHEGWALNVSRGGLRAILEEKVELGAEFDIVIDGSADGPNRRGRIVWLQEEPDGVIVGLEFLGVSGTHASAPASVPPPPPGAQRPPSAAADAPAKAEEPPDGAKS